MAEEMEKMPTNDYQNYRTISLISHPNKVMLRVILNRLVNQAGQILKDEEAGFPGFRSQRGTTEEIFNLKLLEKSTWNIGRNSFIISSTSRKCLIVSGMMTSGES